MALGCSDVEIVFMGRYGCRNPCAQVTFPNLLAGIRIKGVNDSIEPTKIYIVVQERWCRGPMEILSLIGIAAAESPLNLSVF